MVVLEVLLVVAVVETLLDDDELDEVEVAELLDDDELVVPQVAAKLEAFLKLSDKVPLVTLNVVAPAEAMVTVLL